MQKTLLLMVGIFMIKYSSAQITQNNWLVGGTGYFSSTTSRNNAGVSTDRTSNLQINPNIGYFFIDKFAGGIKGSLSMMRTKNITDGVGYNLGKQNRYGIGPFVRYYFLDTEKPFNLLIDGSYQFSIERGGGVNSNGPDPLPVPMTQYSRNTYSIAAGPVIYFNTSVGLELLVSYASSRYSQNSSGTNSVQVGLGLQVHLERED